MPGIWDNAQFTTGIRICLFNVVTIVLKAPPTITPTGTSQNGYYKDTITVNIQDTTNVATRIKYKLNGGAEQTINGTSGSFTIEQDGTHQIEAWTEDNAGNRSTSSNATSAEVKVGDTIYVQNGRKIQLYAVYM